MIKLPTQQEYIALQIRPTLWGGAVVVDYGNYIPPPLVCTDRSDLRRVVSAWTGHTVDDQDVDTLEPAESDGTVCVFWFPDTNEYYAILGSTTGPQQQITRKVPVKDVWPLVRKETRGQWAI